MTRTMRILTAGVLALGLAAAPLAGDAWAQPGSDGSRINQIGEGFGWGLLGLSGLAALAGLMRRDPDRHRHACRPGYQNSVAASSSARP